MPVLFFDFDDTLSEQIPFNLQYVRGMGSALAPLYGGTVEEWAACAADMMAALEADYLARFRNAPLGGYRAWLPGMLSRAVEMLFRDMHLPPPPDPEALARRMRRAALGRCDALFPGAREVVADLHARGFKLHMASGNDSDHLEAVLDAVGLASCMGRLYGPDLIDCAKEGPEFYQRILADMNLDPRQALFIDNDPAAIGWIHTVGAQAIQANLLPHHPVPAAPGVCTVVTDLRQLPVAIARFDAGARS